MIETLYYFYASQYDGTQKVFAGSDRDEVEKMRETFKGLHYQNKATMVYGSKGLVIFEGFKAKK